MIARKQARGKGFLPIVLSGQRGASGQAEHLLEGQVLEVRMRGVICQSTAEEPSIFSERAHVTSRLLPQGRGSSQGQRRLRTVLLRHQVGFFERSPAIEPAWLGHLRMRKSGRYPFQRCNVTYSRWEPYGRKEPVQFYVGAVSNGCPHRDLDSDSGVGSGNSEPFFPEILNRSGLPGKGSSNFR